VTSWLAETTAELSSGGTAVGRAVTVAVWGSAPHPPGACLVVAADGRFAGSVSGGCVEAAAVEEVQRAMEAGAAHVVEYGVSDDTAWSLGLACGGRIRVLAEPRVPPALHTALDSGRPACRATILPTDDQPGGALLVTGSGRSPEDDWPAAWAAYRDSVEAAAREALASGASRLLANQGPDGRYEVFLEVHAPPPTIIVFGAVHIAVALVDLAHAVGYRTVVADGRAAFLAAERFPRADRLLLGWPDEVFTEETLDATTAVCVLTHDPKFDDPALTIALRSAAFYVGALGSRRSHAARLQRLTAAGLTDDQCRRLRGPIGLDLGGRSPEEIAVAVLAEIVATRRGGPVLRPA
jgi:xanthine dehydrogenase accessory factor